jgi:hypothetical protein
MSHPATQPLARPQSRWRNLIPVSTPHVLGVRFIFVCSENLRIAVFKPVKKQVAARDVLDRTEI